MVNLSSALSPLSFSNPVFNLVSPPSLATGLVGIAGSLYLFYKETKKITSKFSTLEENLNYLRCEVLVRQAEIQETLTSSVTDAVVNLLPLLHDSAMKDPFLLRLFKIYYTKLNCTMEVIADEITDPRTLLDLAEYRYKNKGLAPANFQKINEIYSKEQVNDKTASDYISRNLKLAEICLSYNTLQKEATPALSRIDAALKFLDPNNQVSVYCQLIEMYHTLKLKADINRLKKVVEEFIDKMAKENRAAAYAILIARLEKLGLENPYLDNFNNLCTDNQPISVQDLVNIAPYVGDLEWYVNKFLIRTLGIEGVKEQIDLAKAYLLNHKPTLANNESSTAYQYVLSLEETTDEQIHTKCQMIEALCQQKEALKDLSLSIDPLIAKLTELFPRLQRSDLLVRIGNCLLLHYIDTNKQDDLSKFKKIFQTTFQKLSPDQTIDRLYAIAKSNETDPKLRHLYYELASMPLNLTCSDKDKLRYYSSPIFLDFHRSLLAHSDKQIDPINQAIQAAETFAKRAREQERRLSAIAYTALALISCALAAALNRVWSLPRQIK
jgi:hypothetical protein